MQNPYLPGEDTIAEYWTGVEDWIMTGMRKEGK